MLLFVLVLARNTDSRITIAPDSLKSAAIMFVRINNSRTPIYVEDRLVRRKRLCCHNRKHEIPAEAIGPVARRNKSTTSYTAGIVCFLFRMRIGINFRGLLTCKSIL